MNERKQRKPRPAVSLEVFFRTHRWVTASEDDEWPLYGAPVRNTLIRLTDRFGAGRLTGVGRPEPIVVGR